MTTPASALHTGALDRCEPERTYEELLARLAEDPSARVLAVRGDAVPVRGDRLVTVAPAHAAGVVERAFLGRWPDGTPLVLAVVGDDAVAPEDASWTPLRIAGAVLAEADAEAAVTAVSLARWLLDSAFCPNCGEPTTLVNAGWARRCPACGRMHFPRTDPAVIVAIEDEAGEHLLLGSNAAWPQGRFSCFAGFVEAGESLESAVVRELAEEAGVRVVDAVYRGSQAWPYPRSLMLGFQAVADPAVPARADGEEIAEVRWFTRAQIGDALAGQGEITLPGPASIAHRLIVQWHGGTP